MMSAVYAVLYHDRTFWPAHGDQELDAAVSRLEVFGCEDDHEESSVLGSMVHSLVPLLCIDEAVAVDPDVAVIGGEQRCERIREPFGQ
jgi:hypothetical protein